MPEDEKTPESGQEQKTTTEPKEEKPSEETQEQKDYRAKLNATNRFLEKEGYTFQDGKWVKPETPQKEKETPKEPDQSDLSSKDLYALMNNQVHEEDVDEVVKAAKLLGKDIPNALKDPTVQTILKTRNEHRRTAQATNTKAQRPSQKKMTDDEVLAKAQKGEVPEPGSPEAEQLFWARRGGKRD